MIFYDTIILKFKIRQLVLFTLIVIADIYGPINLLRVFTDDKHWDTHQVALYPMMLYIGQPREYTCQNTHTHTHMGSLLPIGTPMSPCGSLFSLVCNKVLSSMVKLSNTCFHSVKRVYLHQWKVKFQSNQLRHPKQTGKSVAQWFEGKQKVNFNGRRSSFGQTMSD